MYDEDHNNRGAFPYPEGTCLLITPHKPASVDDVEAYVPTAEEEDLMRSGEWADRVESVFRFLPPQPPQDPVTEAAPKQLIIDRVLAGGWRHGAQIVLCNLPHLGTTTYVAKIFDPLYFEHPEPRRHWSETLFTLAREAYRYHSSEAGAYERIEEHKGSRPGSYTPDYFGSWCFRTTMCSPARPRPRVSESAQAASY